MNLKKLWRGAFAIGAAAVLSACGGGQVDEFEPSRLLAFGDEMSIIVPADTTGAGGVALKKGSKYSVNFVDSDGALNCRTYPLWTQYVASGFGFTFEGCKSGTEEAKALVLATANAKVADFEAQINGASALTSKDLATVMVGTHDVKELYERLRDGGGTVTRAQVIEEAQARGKQWGELINKLAKAGPRVVVSTIPDLGLSPYAKAEKAEALLSELVKEYNLAMRLALIQDGRLIGLVFGELETQEMVKYDGNYGLDNVTEAICADTAVLPNCSNKTLKSGIAEDKVDNYLWADSFRPGTEFHERMGDLAEYRAKNNPF
ncbi:SGNH/GDSL hydrolase family protein [Aquincola sp. MAHUQ-54]|uniref:SGNH/GDSL hydrolase family protein n=1 Tax=Aquincola agrisoli TaxID=3119538 RepID=A0AAW9QIN1_9BURK